MNDDRASRREDDLARAPTRPLVARLARCVPFLDFDASAARRFLWTSGRPNRWNPSGVPCLCLAEGEETADLEYRSSWVGLKSGAEPKLTFWVEVSLEKVLDLEDAATVKALQLSEADLFSPWRGVDPISPIQALGEAVHRRGVPAAIRYPSLAARRAGRPGWNVAVFVENVREPDRVATLGRAGTILEVIPGPEAGPE